MTAPLHEEEALGKPYDAALMRACCAPPAYAWMTLAPSPCCSARRCSSWRAVPHPGRDRPRDSGKDLHLILVLGLAMAAALLAEFALEYGQTVLTAFIGQRVRWTCGSRSSSSCSACPSLLTTEPGGPVDDPLTSDVETLNDLFTGAWWRCSADVFTLLVIMIWMLVVDSAGAGSFAVIPSCSRPRAFSVHDQHPDHDHQQREHVAEQRHHAPVTGRSASPRRW